MPKIAIRKADITEPVADTVVLQNSVLRNLLVQNPAAAQHWLATHVTPVSTSSITIDDHGRVVITDKAFAAAVTKVIRAGGPVADNMVCSNGSCGVINEHGGISER